MEPQASGGRGCPSCRNLSVQLLCPGSHGGDPQGQVSGPVALRGSSLHFGVFKMFFFSYVLSYLEGGKERMSSFHQLILQ